MDAVFTNVAVSRLVVVVFIGVETCELRVSKFELAGEGEFEWRVPKVERRRVKKEWDEVFIG
jgi:hypothetical protein